MDFISSVVHRLTTVSNIFRFQHVIYVLMKRKTRKIEVHRIMCKVSFKVRVGWSTPEISELCVIHDYSVISKHIWTFYIPS